MSAPSDLGGEPFHRLEPYRFRLNRNRALSLCFERDLIRKPVSTFRDHALDDDFRRSRLVLQFRLNRRDSGFQGRKMLLYEVPDQRVGDAMVLVSQHIADAHNLRPRDIRPARLKVRRNTAGSFGNDFDPALNAMSKKPVGAEIVEGLASHRLLDAFDRLANGLKGRLNKPLRQKTRSAEASIWSLSSGSRLSRVVKST